MARHMLAVTAVLAAALHASGLYTDSGDPQSRSSRQTADAEQTSQTPAPPGLVDC